MKDKYWFKGGIILFFFMMLFLVGSKAIGSDHVSMYNNGFGTFDMKQYDEKIIYEVLTSVKQGYVSSVKCYYLVDYIFCIAFFSFQWMLADSVFKRSKKSKVRTGLIGIAALRGIADGIENGLLLYIICSYPIKHIQMIQVASSVTRIKMLLMVLWVVTFIISVIAKYIKK